MNKVESVAEKFINSNEIISDIGEYGQGIIHDTYLVRFDGHQVFILQELNTKVFKNPAAIMHNLTRVTEHIQNRIRLGAKDISPEWQMEQVIPTRDGKDFFIDISTTMWLTIIF